MKSKLFMKLILTFSLLLLCLGCQSDQSKNIIISNENQETINLHFYGFKSEAMNVVAIEETLQNYMKENSHIQISYESVKGSEYYDILEKRLKSGNYDDIFMIDEDHLQKLKKDGYFADLSQISTIQNYSQRSLEQMQETDNKIYYVPSTISAFGLYCNMELLKQYQQSVPQNEKEFLAVCEYFINQGITPIIANNDISLKTIAIAKGLTPLYQNKNSQEIIQHINDDPQILVDYMRPGYEFVEELIQKKYVNAALTLKTMKTQDDLIQFMKGENPFMLTGAWAAARIEKDAPDLDFEVHPYPILENGSILVTNIDTRLCVNAKGKHVEEAKKFIEYMTQTDIMWKFVDNQCSFSPLKENKLSTNEKVQPLNDYLSEEKSLLGNDALIHYEMWSLTKQGVQILLEGGKVEDALQLIKDAK